MLKLLTRKAPLVQFLHGRFSVLHSSVLCQHGKDILSSSKRKKILFCILVILTLLVPTAVLADNETENIIVPSTETIDGPGFYAGKSVQIDGIINGTTFAVGQRVVVNGTINGDLLTGGQEVTINGKIMGNLYIAGQNAEVNGQVMGDTFGAGQTVYYTKSSSLGRDGFAAGQDVNLAGKIQRKLFAAGDNIDIVGQIGDNAQIEANTLHINDGAQIGGGLSYTSSSQAYLAPNAKISGPVDWKKTEPKPTSPKPQRDIYDGVGWFIFSTLGALLFWFLISLWRPAFWSATSAIITIEPLKTLGIGALALILTPIAVILLMITIIGIPLGVILALVYGVSIWLSHIIVAIFTGYWLAGRFNWPLLHKGVWFVLLGLTLVTILSHLPFVGFLVSLAIILAGLGSIVLTLAKPQASPPPAGPPIFNSGE